MKDTGEVRVMTRVPAKDSTCRLVPAEVTLVAEWPHGRLVRNDYGYYRFEPKQEEGYSTIHPFVDDPWQIPFMFGEEVRAAMRADIERRKRAKYADLLRRIENGAKPCFVRFGAPPKSGRSYDYRDNRYEPGVAVYSAFVDKEGVIIDLRGTDAVSALFIIGCRDMYIVDGTVVGQTSDGTPAVKVSKVRRTRKPYRVLL